jgi:hypothetical protein
MVYIVPSQLDAYTRRTAAEGHVDGRGCGKRDVWTPRVGNREFIERSTTRGLRRAVMPSLLVLRRVLALGPRSQSADSPNRTAHSGCQHSQVACEWQAQ